VWHKRAETYRSTAACVADRELDYAAASLSPAIRSGLAFAVALAALAGSSANAAGGSGGAMSDTGGATFVETPTSAQTIPCPKTCRQLPPEALARDSHVFPIPGRHSFGSAGSGFGSGRAGHSHQGHDVFARCGAPLVAARGGTVQRRAFHPLSGNYLIVDGEGTDLDYAYMHLARRSPLRKGATVATGQRIGTVGDTGNARGCHLHFELWTGPGYYEGGHAIDPLRALKAWDSWS
jgi:murein DD-endopeptidase MepM/ murein hydrolase activator NlpD